MFFAIEDAHWREHLDPDVVALSHDIGDCARRQFVHERRGVVTEQGKVGDLFPAHDCGREVAGEVVRPSEGAFGGVNVDLILRDPEFDVIRDP